jgi:hypothetical protein
VDEPALTENVEGVGSPSFLPAAFVGKLSDEDMNFSTIMLSSVSCGTMHSDVKYYTFFMFREVMCVIPLCFILLLI